MFAVPKPEKSTKHLHIYYLKKVLLMT